MSQPTDPTHPSVPRDPNAPTPPPGRRVSDSRHTFPADAPAPPSAPPPSAASDRPTQPGQTGESPSESSTGSGPTATGPQTQRSPLVPQIGSSEDGRAGTGASGRNPYGPAGARYSSETPPPAAGLATGAIPRVNPTQSGWQNSAQSGWQNSAQCGAAQSQAGPPGVQQPGHAGPQQPGQTGPQQQSPAGADGPAGYGTHAPVPGPIPHSGHSAPTGTQPTVGGEVQSAVSAGALAQPGGQVPQVGS